MSADYAPGTVAVATVRGVEGVRVMRIGDDSNGLDWRSCHYITGTHLHYDGQVTDVRPLVVLDLDALDTPAPDEGETVAHYVVRTLRGLAHGLATRRAIADQIEAQTKPPKPEEPKGLGAVVEDSGHILWVRVSNTPGTFPWLRDGHGVRGWHEIDAARVLSEGVTS